MSDHRAPAVPEEWAAALAELATRTEAASAMGGHDKLAYDAIIDPRDLRDTLITGLALATARSGGNRGHAAPPAPPRDATAKTSAASERGGNEAITQATKRKTSP